MIFNTLLLTLSFLGAGFQQEDPCAIYNCGNLLNCAVLSSGQIRCERIPVDSGELENCIVAFEQVTCDPPAPNYIGQVSAECFDGTDYVPCGTIDLTVLAIPELNPGQSVTLQAIISGSPPGLAFEVATP